MTLRFLERVEAPASNDEFEPGSREELVLAPKQFAREKHRRTNGIRSFSESASRVAGGKTCIERDSNMCKLAAYGWPRIPCAYFDVAYPSFRRADCVRPIHHLHYC